MDIKKINRTLTIIKSKIRELELESIKKNKLKISDIQWNYLVWSVEQNGITLTQLSKHLGVQKGTLSNNIKHLEKKGLINKIKIENSLLVEIKSTKKGEEYIKVHNNLHKDIYHKLSNILSKEEIEIMLKASEKIKNHL